MTDKTKKKRAIWERPEKFLDEFWLTLRDVVETTGEQVVITIPGLREVGNHFVVGHGLGFDTSLAGEFCM